MFARVRARASLSTRSGSLFCNPVATLAAGRDASHFPALYPALAADVALFEDAPSPAQRGLFSQDSYHSSVLRLSSADTSLWTHYDIMDNVLMQVLGTKRVVLFPPADEAALYVQGSSSRVPDVDAPMEELAAAWPRLPPALARRREGVLAPGEALFIPALWLHAVTAGPEFRRVTQRESAALHLGC